MKTLYVVAGNGFARECHMHIQGNIQKGHDIRFGGFVGYDHFRSDHGVLNQYFIGDLSEVTFKEDDYCIIGLGNPVLRKEIYQALKARNIKLYNLIVGGDLYEYVDIGEGNILIESHPSAFTKIGNGNVFNTQVIVGHDTTVGDFNFFCPRSQLLGCVSVGNGNTVGAGSVLLPNSKIGNDNKIAPLSAVYKGCRNNSYMQGNPALKVGVVEA